MLANQDIRQTAKDYGVKLWEVAQYLQISDGTLSKRLRVELTTTQKQEYFDAIVKITRQKALECRVRRYAM